MAGETPIRALPIRILAKVGMEIERLDMADDRVGQVGGTLVYVTPDQIAEPALQDAGFEVGEIVGGQLCEKVLHNLYLPG